MCETAGRRCPSSHPEARRLRRHMERRQSLYLTGTTNDGATRTHNNPEDQQTHDKIHEDMERLRAQIEARRAAEKSDGRVAAHKRAGGRSQSNAGAYSLSNDELANLYG